MKTDMHIRLCHSVLVFSNSLPSIIPVWQLC